MNYELPETPERDSPRKSFTRRLLLAGAIIIVFAGFGGGIWYAYQAGVKQGSEQTAPLIVAGDTPIKVRPETPGGMDVPHQDKLVYEKIQPGELPPPQENLLPPAEEPVVRREAEETTSSIPKEVLTPPPAASGPDTLPPDSEATADAPPPVPASPAAPPDPEPPQAAEMPTTPEPASPSVETAPRPESTLAMIGPYRLQLASMRSPEAATAAWEKLEADHPDLLGGFDLIIEKVDLGEDRGIFYRVQAGPVTSDAHGKDLCDKLKARDVACLVIKR